MKSPFGELLELRATLKDTNPEAAARLGEILHDLGMQKPPADDRRFRAALASMAGRATLAGMSYLDAKELAEQAWADADALLRAERG